MDKSWMLIQDRLFSKEFEAGVELFMSLAEKNVDTRKMCRCPCRFCQNAYWKPLSVIERHIYRSGMSATYTRWIFHGEAGEDHEGNLGDQVNAHDVEEINDDDDIGPMIDDLARASEFEEENEDMVGDSDRVDTFIGESGRRGRGRGSQGGSEGSRGGSTSSWGRGCHNNSIEDMSASHGIPNPLSDPATPLSQPQVVPPHNTTPSTSSSRVLDTSQLPHFSHQAEVNSNLDPPTQLRVKRKRGETRGIELDAYVAAYGKIPLVFDPETRRPTSEKFSSWLSSECGSIARRFAPQKLQFWSEITKQDYNSLFQRLEYKFIIDKEDAEALKCVEHIMGHAYREQRSNHASLIRTFGDLSVTRNFNEACKRVPDYMTQEDWKFLVTLVASPEFQERSERNKRNRSKLLYGHRGGSKPFVHHKKKNSLGSIGLFYKTHYVEGKGWVNDEAEARYRAMVALQEQPPSQGSQPLSEPEITQQVLGHRSGYVRGLGWGPVPPSRFNGAESSRVAEERAQRELERVATNERLNALEMQNQQLQRHLNLVLSILRATGASITGSMAEELGLSSDQSPPPDDQ